MRKLKGIKKVRWDSQYYSVWVAGLYDARHRDREYLDEVESESCQYREECDLRFPTCGES
jgi:hypothetical protein